MLLTTEATFDFGRRAGTSFTSIASSIIFIVVSKLVVTLICLLKIDTSIFWRETTSPSLKPTSAAFSRQSTSAIWPVSSAKMISRFSLVSPWDPTVKASSIFTTFAFKLKYRVFSAKDFHNFKWRTSGYLQRSSRRNKQRVCINNHLNAAGIAIGFFYLVSINFVRFWFFHFSVQLLVETHGSQRGISIPVAKVHRKDHATPCRAHFTFAEHYACQLFWTFSRRLWNW